MSQDVAIIGLSGRFPGARDVSELWSNVRDGVESIRSLTEQELLLAGVDDKQLRLPNYVRAASTLDKFDHFDASLFECSPMEATLMDPQQRVLLEVAWEAFENAGYDPTRCKETIGIFAGAGGSANSYLVSDIHVNHGLRGATGTVQHLGNDRDYLASRVAFKLGLRGPSITVQAACATSLVALHLACQAVLSGECEMALAGAVNIRIPQLAGYLYEDGGMVSSDGHCRPFDAKASGTVFGSGAALILVKPLDAALADGDRIHAVIKGSAVNNDGSAKLSFAVANGTGIANVVAEALAVARVEPTSVSLVMAHANGNAMGDAIEFRALTQVFRANRKGYCALSSVKGHIGHLEQAAGFAALSVAVEAMHRRTLPPTLNYERPNPQINLARSPFFISTEPAPWSSEGPRRACITSVGIGGTNACVVLEEPPPPPPRKVISAPSTHLLRLSAHTPNALVALARRFANAVDASDALDDLCYTAEVGRRQLQHQVIVLGRSSAEVADALRMFSDGQKTPAVLLMAKDPAAERGVTLVVGNPAPSGHRALCERSVAFRTAVERCDEVATRLGKPLLSVVSGYEIPRDSDLHRLASFAVSLGYAELLRSLGLNLTSILVAEPAFNIARCLDNPGELAECLATVLQVDAQASPPAPFDLNAPRAAGCKMFIAVGEPAATAVEGETWITLAASSGEAELDDIARGAGVLASLGVPLTWSSLDEGRVRRRVSLPTYPFQHERYWLEPSAARREGDGPSAFQPRKIASPVLRESILEGEIDLRSRPFLGDYRVAEQIVLPVAAILELVRFAALDVLADEPWMITDLTFAEAMIVPAQGPRIFQVITRGDGRGGWSFEIFSRSAEPGGVISWTEHVSGGLRGVPVTTDEAPSFDASAARARCRETVTADKIYSDLRISGFDFGPAFRCIKRVVRREGELVAEIEAPAGVEGPDIFLLEACIQAASASIGPPSGEQVYFAFGLESARVDQAIPSRCSAHVVFRETAARGDTFVVDVRIHDATRIVAELKGLTFRRAPLAALQLQTFRQAVDWLYELAWHPEAGSPGGGQEVLDGTWLVIGNGALGRAVCAHLERGGAACVSWPLPRGADVDTVRSYEEPLRTLFASEPLKGVVYLAAGSSDAPTSDDSSGADVAAAVARACAGALQLTRGLLAVDPPILPRMAVVTHGAHAVGDETRTLEQSALAGLMRVLAYEHPALGVTCIDLDRADSVEDAEFIVRELALESRESLVASRAGSRYVARLVRSAPPRQRVSIPEDHSFRLHATIPGVLESITSRTMERLTPGRGEVEIAVHAVGLGSRDFVGLHDAKTPLLGVECAGTVSAVGADVTAFRVGDEVVALAEGSLGSHVSTSAKLVAHKPKGLPPDVAATLPADFVTADYALRTLGKIGPGKRVLVHVGPSALGLAAIQVAKRLGAEVFATAGPRALDMLRSFGADHVLSSRDPVPAELKAVGGIDVVLDARAEPVASNDAILAKNGRVIAVARHGGKVAPVSSQHGRPIEWLDIVRLMRDVPEELGASLAAVVADVEERRLRPLPFKSFAFQDVVSAFRAERAARGFGKVLVSMSAAVVGTIPPPSMSPRRGGKYIITGASGPAALVAAEWLAKRNASHLVLIGKEQSQPDVPENRLPRDVITRITERGVTVDVLDVDVSDMNELRTALERTHPEVPLLGVIHAEAASNSRPVAQETWDDIAAATRSTVLGAWNLHLLTRAAPLEFFAFFSAPWSFLGANGKARSALVGGFVEALANLRREQGLPSLNICWGPWEGLPDAHRDWTCGSAGAIPGAVATRILEWTLEVQPSHTVVLPFRWQTLAQQFPRFKGEPILMRLMHERMWPRRRSNDRSEILDQLARANTREERLDLMSAFVEALVLRSLGMSPTRRLDAREGFKDLGLNSLTSVQLRHELHGALRRPLAHTITFNYPNIAALSAHLVDQLFAKRDSRPASRPASRLSRGPQVPQASPPPIIERPEAGNEVDDWVERELGTLELLLKKKR